MSAPSSPKMILSPIKLVEEWMGFERRTSSGLMPVLASTAWKMPSSSPMKTAPFKTAGLAENPASVLW